MPKTQPHSHAAAAIQRTGWRGTAQAPTSSEHISTAPQYWLGWWLRTFFPQGRELALPCTAGARPLPPFSSLVQAIKMTPARESSEGYTHPVKALGLEEVAVGAV